MCRIGKTKKTVGTQVRKVSREKKGLRTGKEVNPPKTPGEGKRRRRGLRKKNAQGEGVSQTVRNESKAWGFEMNQEKEGGERSKKQEKRSRASGSAKDWGRKRGQGGLGDWTQIKKGQPENTAYLPKGGSGCCQTLFHKKRVAVVRN